MVFPLEMFKGPYYRVIRSSEEFKMATEHGWSEIRSSNHPYLPVSAAAAASVAPVVVPVKEELPAHEVVEPFKRGPGRPPKIREEVQE